MNNRRTLTQMPGFKKGYEAPTSLQSDLGDINQSSEEHLAFVLGALAKVYSSIKDPEKLWELRKKVWQIEERLGELQKNRSHQK